MGLFGPSVKAVIKESKEFYAELARMPYQLRQIERTNFAQYKEIKTKLKHMINKCAEMLKRLAIKESEIEELTKYLRIFHNIYKRNFT